MEPRKRYAGDDGRKTVLVGSSGGGGATLGNATTLYDVLARQLRAIGSTGACIVGAQLVVCDAPLDMASGSQRGALYVLGPAGSLALAHQGSLDAVNARAREVDALLARRIAGEVIDGVVSISADARPGGVNARVLAAAGRARLPVAGTGGSSLSIAAAEWGCRVVGNSGGSVATTSESKAIGIAAALAAAWREPYAPAPAVRGAGGWHSPIDGCLPAFLAISCSARALDLLQPLLSAQPAARSAALAETLRTRALAPILGAIAAQHRSGLGELAVLGGALIGALCQGSALAALLGAAALAAAAPRCLAACARWSVPATATSLLLGGGLPVAIGLLAHAAAPSCAQLTAAVRACLALALGGATHADGVSSAARLAHALSGGLAGLAMSWGSRRGLYHALFLPLIALEAERGELALLGALDLLALCVVGAGVCAAQLALPRRASAGRDAPLARRGLAINLLCGDYVEACFPFLERDRLLNAAALCAGALAGALCARAPGGVRSTAYLPLPVAVALSDNPAALARAALVAFCVPLTVGVARNAAANAREASRQRAGPAPTGGPQSSRERSSPRPRSASPRPRARSNGRAAARAKR